jgi:hypothetical protein
MYILQRLLRIVLYSGGLMPLNVDGMAAPEAKTTKRW